MGKTSSGKQPRPTRSSPTKSKNKAAEDTGAGKVARGPSRCNKCEGRPLRSQCCHTKAGENYLREQQIISNLNTAPAPTETTPNLNSNQDHTPTDIPVPHQATSGPFPSPASTRITNEVIDPQLRTPSSSHDAFLSSASTRIAADLIEPVICTPNLSRTYISSVSAFSSPLGAKSSGTQASLGAGDSIGADDSIGTDSPTSTDINSTSSSVNMRKKARRAKVKDPYHGFVTDVYRGTQPFSLCRTHAVPSRIENIPKASATFLDTMSSIIQKCEDLSTQTSCWLFIGAQHPNASGETLHYASPRLQRDVPEIGDLASEFCAAISHAKEVRRRDFINVQKELSLARQERENLQLEMQALVSEKNSQAAKLLRYEEQYGSLNVDIL